MSSGRKKKVSTTLSRPPADAGDAGARSRSPAKAATEDASGQSAKAKAPAPRSKQPSIATLMMLKKKIGDIRARQRRNRPFKKYENTYQLEPDVDKKFAASEVAPILSNSLRFFLGESKYDPRASPKLAKMVSEDVKRRMKNNFNCPRYKIVVHVTVVQKAEQSLAMVSRSVLDSATDDFVTSTLERPTFTASATAYWFYFE